MRSGALIQMEGHRDGCWRLARVRVALRGHDARLEVRDAPLAARAVLDPSAPPAPGARLAFSATAYCKGLVTTSGVAVQKRRGRGRSDAAAGRLGDRDRVAERSEIRRHLHASWTPARQFRAAQSTSTCGAATRRCGSAASRSTSPCLRLGWNPARDDAELHRSHLQAHRATRTPLPSRPLADRAGRSRDHGFTKLTPNARPEASAELRSPATSCSCTAARTA